MSQLVHITQANVGLYMRRVLEIENLSFPTPWSVEAFRGELRNSLSRLWGWEEEDRLQGYICYWITMREIQVLNVAVHPDQRRRGVGTGLIRRAVRSGIAHGVEELWLEVRTSNRSARNLYEKLGFRAVGRRSRYYRDTGEDAIVMTLPISVPYPLSTANQRAREV